MKHGPMIVISVLIGITVFSISKYIVSLKRNRDLAASMQQLNVQLATLEEEKKSALNDLARERDLGLQLNRENSQLKDQLTQEKLRLAALDAQMEESQRQVETLGDELSLVQSENTALRGRIQELQLNISQVTTDKEKLQSQLESIDELKKAIKTLRKKMRTTRKQIGRRLQARREIAGNMGYLIKDGKPTGEAAIKIEVQPADALEHDAGYPDPVLPQ